MAGTPRFSIVTAVYNVEPYLPDFIASIDRLHVDEGQLEVIAVDDGSTDGSPELLAAWAARRPELLRVLRQPNAGQASARNMGLEHSRGEWVTFTDPDDMLDQAFFRTAAGFADAHPDLDFMAAKPVILQEDQERLFDNHPRREQYDEGNRRVDLRREPNTFPGSSAVSFYRRSVLASLGLRFDERVRPNFEDGHFAVRYLLGLPAPVVGLLRDAKFLYRKRAAHDSTSNLSLSDPGRYSTVFEHGYLDVLRAAEAKLGHVPAWLQHVVIYELSWYLSKDDKISTGIRIDDDLVDRFHELFATTVRYLDPEVVASHTARNLKPAWADILSHVGRGPWVSPVALRSKFDRAMKLERITYRYLGDPPAESFEANGRPVNVAFGKHRALLYYRRPMMSERIAWIPRGRDIRLRLNGRAVPVTVATRRGRRGLFRRGSWRERLWIYRRISPRLLAGRFGRRISTTVYRNLGRAMVAVSRLPAYRGRFANAWVLMDRTYEADDNGERLFEYLRANRPEINAWFVLSSTSADWDRLHAAAKGLLVRHGSFAWRMLLLNAAWLLSSHADRDIVEPRELVRLTGARTWRYAFLQHGVIKDDLSLWLNQRDLDMFVVSTEAERASVVDDGTAYLYTTKETRLTGLPRFDRLLRKAAEVAPQDRDLVLIAPTWRTWLTERPESAATRRQLVDWFQASEYFVSWRAILASTAIAEAAGRVGVRLAFMPHPNFQELLGDMDLPPHVEPMSFAGNDVQGLYARCALLVTDYSSVAFNAAVLDRPIVYFQFDFEAMMAGAHMGRQGYFDYVRDGFGPVARDVDGAIAAIVDALVRGPRPAPEYQQRIDATFSVRDGRACERVVAVVEELSQPYPRQRAS